MMKSREVYLSEVDSDIAEYVTLKEKIYNECTDEILEDIRLGKIGDLSILRLRELFIKYKQAIRNKRRDSGKALGNILQYLAKVNHYYDTNVLTYTIGYLTDVRQYVNNNETFINDYEEEADSQVASNKKKRLLDAVRHVVGYLESIEAYQGGADLTTTLAFMRKTESLINVESTDDVNVVKRVTEPEGEGVG